MPGMRFTIGINRYLNAGPALRTTLVSVAPPGETAYTAMPEGSRRASAATHQAIMSFASAYAFIRIVGHVLHVRPVANQGFHSGGSVTLVVFGRKSWQVGVFEHGHAPASRFGAGDYDPRVGAQQTGAKQPDSQLMMADQRGLRRLDARRSEL